MRIKIFLLCALTLAGVTAIIGQGPMYDKVIVNFPYAVTINDTVLQPGEYTIRQHESTGGASRIVHIFSDQGMKLETTAMAIPALDNKTPEDTKVVLNHTGNDYYLNKIWIQGKNYGYEFPVPERFRKREMERTEPASVVARYEAVPDETATVAQNQNQTEVTRTTTETTTTTTEESRQVARNEPAPQPVPEAQPEPQPAPVQAAPEAAPRTETAATTPQAGEQTFADRTSSPNMPATSADWMSLLIGGGFLTSAGFALRRARS